MKVGGLAEFVDEGKTGFIIEPDSPDAIRDGVTKFLSAKGNTDFHKHIERKNKQNSFSQLPDVFEQILDESK